MSAGSYGLLDASAPAALGLPLLAAGAALATAGLAVGSRRAVRSRYRPDPWGSREWLVSASGAAPAVAAFVGRSLDPAALDPSTSPLAVPGFPLLLVAAVLVALLPVAVTR